MKKGRQQARTRSRRVSRRARAPEREAELQGRGGSGLPSRGLANVGPDPQWEREEELRQPDSKRKAVAGKGSRFQRVGRGSADSAASARRKTR
jgi:hypothetical protein